ncbi:septal ring lytic transglycosylase RlpA family protein [Aurantiacibacter poecillastricola]|uniref:septal ring lytic transglycosylase RlpA family protein n=1 Tax=Aurantiacibacter poecillastricola TaxID=3064385 RepID=UPI00273EAE64|nr:septal ring lytic transglycosylase RlpA family protein [Aurantiacibacter sp. 219JJ12-13]MDP5263151.1 septal ring lytic transglycosylase RlpA family protein [Aurantiacibacter sp. 219JJ12-13]
MRNNNSTTIADHHLPSRRERLRTFMRLKSQRRMALLGTGVFAALSLALGAELLQDRTTPDIVKLGDGRASVEAMPVAELEGLELEPIPANLPVPQESAMGAGDASYYGDELAGNRTASGEVFDPQQLTAAHRTLPLGSEVRVTNPRNGESVVVRVNDRGPYHGNRVIDLSYAAAREIGLISSGTGRVNLALLVS